MQRTRIRSVSTRRAVQLKEYSRLRREYLENHPYCEWWLSEHGLTQADVVNGMVEWNRGFQVVWLPVPRSTEIHHKRGRFGSRLNETEYWMAVSIDGHRWIHANPKESYERGYLLAK